MFSKHVYGLPSNCAQEEHALSRGGGTCHNLGGGAKIKWATDKFFDFHGCSYVAMHKLLAKNLMKITLEKL